MKRPTRIPHAKGFALVASLLLMILLTVIAVGLLSLSAITLRTSTQGLPMAVARANARLALQIAIAELQKQAGPDQRITASADLTGSSHNSMWTGVWKTHAPNDPSKPMVSGHTNGKFLTDLRNTDASLKDGKWKEALRVGWLVSGEGFTPQGVEHPASGTSTSGTPVTIQLVGKASLGGIVGVDDSRLVSVPYVKVVPANKTPGGYAYWVGDESQKARIDVGSPYDNKQPDPSKPADGGMYRLAGAGGPDFTDVKAAASMPYSGVRNLTGSQRGKLVSRATLALQTAGIGSPSANFHDITTFSKGMLTNVVMGGLQKDFSAVLERTSDIPAISGVNGTGMALNQKILSPANYSQSGPGFAQIRDWYHLKDVVKGGMLNARIDQPEFITTRPGISGAYYDLTAPLPDITSKTQAIQPLLADCRIAFDFSLDTSTAPQRGGAGRSVRLHLYPRVTLWNPYNITLKGVRYFVGCNMPQVNNLAVNGQSVTSIPGSDGAMYPGVTGKTLYFTLAATDIGPGEALVFSPDLSASSGVKLAGNAIKYDTSNIASNVLSASIPGGTNNFYFESNRVVPPTVNLAAKPDYNFSGGVNQAFDNAPTMFLKYLDNTSGSIPLSLLNSPQAKTIQLIQYGQNGSKSGWWWYLFGSARQPVNGGEGFQNYSLNPNRYPPRLWSVETRLRWLDETDEQNSLGITHDGAGGEFFYNNPVMGNFNVRANMVHRDPFSYYLGWPKYAPGGYMMPWSMPRLNDPRMDTPYRNGKSRGSPFSSPGLLSAAPAFAMFDLPRPGTSVFSLAAFQHVQLGFHSWQPTYVIGNSIAEPRSNRDQTVNAQFFNLGESAWGSELAVSNQRPGQWSGLVQNLGAETLIYDMSYQVNQALWDRFFLSTIPYSGGSPSWQPGKESLPNSRLELFAGEPTGEQKKLLTGANHFDYAACFLANNGSFNVNSTRVEAWRALFSTLNHVERPTADGKTMPGTFSRLLFPMSDASPDALQSSGAWHGARKLSSAEIETLAQTMVGIVKKRGPFLGLADFVNRRLTAATTNDMNDPSICGPLQAAIELAGINLPLQQSRDITSSDAAGANQNDGSIIPDWNAFYHYKNFGAPGYLTQADVLQTVGPNLTTRGDTFVIRTYGDACDASGKIIARAWCEAVVQRQPDYIEGKPAGSPSDTSGNNPAEPALIGPAQGGDFTTSLNSSLRPLNRKFGRRFTIENFRWLSSSEI